MVLRQEEELKKVYKYSKCSSKNQSEMMTELHEVHNKVEDITNWMDECVNEIGSLKTKSKRMHNMLQKITKNMKLPQEQYVSDTDNNTRKPLFLNHGNRQMMRRRNKQRNR